MRFFIVLVVVAAIPWACSKTLQSGQANTPATEPASSAAIPAYPDIATLSGMLDRGASSSVALVTEALKRARDNAGLNAFITLDAEGAMRRAAELDRQRAAGAHTGPLYGIPLVVKDNIHVAGLPNTAGTPALKGFVPSASNEVVARLQAAGAIIIGKTNMHELAFGITSDNAAFGAVRNPYDPSLIPGGSSGGTAVAISTGIVAAGLGTDTGGSVRIPAALTGIVGFRPSTGRYPSQAVTPISHTRDTVGLMARTVGDVVALDNVIVPAAPPLTEVAAPEIRLGVPRGYYYQDLDSEAAAVVAATLEKLSAAKVQLIEADVPDLAALLKQSAFPIALFEVAQDLPAYLQTFATGTDFAALSAAAASPDVNGALQMVSGPDRVTEEAYAAALAARKKLRQNFRDYFAGQRLDGIIFPTTLLPARPIEGGEETVELNGARVPTFPIYIHNTDPASIAALPAISLPAGLTAAGLPVGIEVDGPEQSDRHLLAAARTLEAIIAFKGWPKTTHQ